MWISLSTHHPSFGAVIATPSRAIFTSSDASMASLAPCRAMVEEKAKSSLIVPVALRISGVIVHGCGIFAPLRKNGSPRRSRMVWSTRRISSGPRSDSSFHV